MGPIDEEGVPADLAMENQVLMRLLVCLMGEESAPQADIVSPPADLRRAVRCAPTPVLRGVLMDAIAELGRRSGGRGSK